MINCSELLEFLSFTCNQTNLKSLRIPLILSQNLWSEKKASRNGKSCEGLKVQCRECGQAMKTEDRQVLKHQRVLFHN